MSFKAGYIYPLVEADNYDDDLGQGFDHVAIEREATPGDCYIHDAWVVNAKGEVHPGYDANPIPIRISDVVVEKGRELAGDIILPTPMSIFDSPFARRA